MRAIRTQITHRGCHLSYQVEGDGPPVVLIQGTGLHGEGWRPQVDGLADRYRCLTFDNRGMGRSQPQGAPISVAQMADDALALIEAQGWGSAHLIGHSLGGLIALQLALAARPRVRSLSLLCTFADGRQAMPMSPEALWTSLRSYIGPRRWRRRAFLELVAAPGELRGADREALAASLAPLFGHDLGDQPPVVLRQVSAMRACDLTPRLGELAGLPTMVMSAAHDRVAPPRVGRVLAAGIPGARYVEIAGAAHGAPIQRAAEVNALLAEHLARAEHRPGAADVTE